jgi:hypothetical protein
VKAAACVCVCVRTLFEGVGEDSQQVKHAIAGYEQIVVLAVGTVGPRWSALRVRGCERAGVSS